ncbi:MAG: HAD-IIA family hydrolase [bacterium]|nr:HAD-IIA family hydrolase [bacterium]
MNDLFGRSTEELQHKKLFLFDMDGTINYDNQLFDGAIELLQQIEERGGNYMFITNNSSKSVDDYIKKVHGMGIEADVNCFLTSAQATVLYLREEYEDKKVYVIGTESFKEELRNGHVELVEPEEAEVLLVGYDTELTYEKWANACRLLYTTEIPFIATNPDLCCPTAFGYIPDCGSICNVLKEVTKKEPIYIGKPRPTMVELSMELHGCSKEETVVIGDRLYTDIACGDNAGVTTVCVLTGEATIEEIENSEVKPTITLNNVKEMYEILKMVSV